MIGGRELIAGRKKLAVFMRFLLSGPGPILKCFKKIIYPCLEEKMTSFHDMGRALPKSKNFWVITLTTLLFNCAPKFENENLPPKNVPSTISAENLGSFLKAEVVPHDEPEKYLVYFSWPHIDENK